MSIQFEATPAGVMRLRHGSFRVRGRVLETPQFFPLVNLMTGPPTPPHPVMGSGGVWKWLKRLMLRDVHVPPEAGAHPRMDAFITQVLHFLDYRVTSDVLDAWLGAKNAPRGLPVTERLRAELAPAVAGGGRRDPPFLFVDSGGYKLLGRESIDLSGLNWDPTPRDILELQLRFGGDFLATLDYPVHPLATDAEARQRQQLSMDNAIEAFRLLADSGVEDKLLYLAVHGRDKREMHDYVRLLLKRVQAEGHDRPFGLAIGSLVPLNPNPRHLARTLSGAIDGLHAAPGFDANRIPVHAFGVNGSLAPFLPLLGVDSYDGSSFVQAAQNLTYYSPGGLTPERFGSLRTLTCRCRACMLIARGQWVSREDKHRTAPSSSLAAVQYILYLRTNGNASYFHWEDDYVDYERAPPRTKEEHIDPELCQPGVPRSYFYALLALHNLDTNLRLAEVARRVARNPQEIETLIKEAAANPKAWAILQALSADYPELAEHLWRVGTQLLADQLEFYDKSEFAQVRPLPVKLNVKRIATRGTDSRSESAPRVATNPHLGPEAFDVADTSWELRRTRVLLLLPCSKRKPYSASSTHRVVLAHLQDAGLPEDAFERVTISGNYGPVPAAYECADNVLAYDYALSHRDATRIEMVVERTTRFLARWEHRFDVVVGYATPRPYRRVMELAFQGRRNAVLLPHPLRSHTLGEFRRAENLDALAAEMRKHAEGEIHAV